MQMFLSIGFAAAGVVGAVYSLSAAALGLANGPLCYWNNADDLTLKWGTPFANRYRQSLWTEVIHLIFLLETVENYIYKIIL